MLATVLDFAVPGYGKPAGGEGGSWMPLLQSPGRGVISRPIDRLVWHQAVEVEHPQSAIRQGDFKWLYFWDSKEGFLFDLANDLGETRNVAKLHPEVAARLDADLQRHVRAGLGESAFATLEQGGTPQPGGGGKGKRPRRGMPAK